MELVIILGVLGIAAAYWAGHRRGGRAWREEKRQREIEGRLMGREDSGPRNAADAAVIRKGRMEGTHSWEK